MFLIDPVANSNVKELLCRFLTPPTQLCYLNLLRELQTQPAKHTDGASSGRLHSDAQVRSQNHQKIMYLESLSDSLFILSLCLCLTEFCYAILCVCQNSVTLLCENVPHSVKAWVCVFLRVPFTTRSAPLSWPRPSQMVTRGGMQLTSNRTRATT